MRRLNTTPRVGINDPVLQRELREHALMVNKIADGRIEPFATYTAAPTTGTWAAGDFVRNSAPVEAGTAASKYVIFGWLCTVSGEPGTFVETRFLTGN